MTDYEEIRDSFDKRLKQLKPKEVRTDIKLLQRAKAQVVKDLMQALKTWADLPNAKAWLLVEKVRAMYVLKHAELMSLELYQREHQDPHLQTVIGRTLGLEDKAKSAP